MSEDKSERYAPEAVMKYNAAISVADKLESEDLLLPKDKAKIIVALNKKYGFDSDSIFAA